MADCSKTEVFLQEWGRMCKLCDLHYEDCAKCILHNENTVRNDINLAIKMVQIWSDKHPCKTRQSEFLKMFPNAQLDDKVVPIRPCLLEGGCITLNDQECEECRKEYWLAEVE